MNFHGPLPDENMYKDRPPIPVRVKKNTMHSLEVGRRTSIACIAFSIALIHQLLGHESLSWQLNIAAIFVSIALPLHIIGMTKVDQFTPELHDFNFIHDAAPMLGAVGSFGMLGVGVAAIFTAWHFSGIAAVGMLVSTIVACVLVRPGLSPTQDWEIDFQDPVEEELNAKDL